MTTTARSPRRTSLVPPQHGAWAFLGLPLVLGVLASPWSWSTALLAWAAFTLYPASYFALGVARARRGGRFRRPLGVWAAAATPPCIALLATAPWLVWVALAYAVLFGLNLAYARRNRERDLGNDVVLSAQAVALVPLTCLLAAPLTSSTSPWAPTLDQVPARVWLLTSVCAVVLLGSTLHVKSLLRERRNPRYAEASRAFALVSLALAAAVGWRWGLPEGLGLVIPVGVLAVRAHKRDWTGWRPARIGLVELACFLIVAGGAAVALA